jgi:hypothetical protein
MFEGDGLMSQDLRGFVQLAALAAVGVSCLMVAACGQGSSAAVGGASGASASASSTPDPLAGLSVSEIVAKAIANLEAASSLTMDGSLLISGQPFTLSLGIKPGEGCTGSIGLGDKGNIKLILIGKTVYVNADDAYWEATAGSKADAAIQWANGRYIKTTTSSMTGVTNLCDLSQVLGPVKPSETMTKGKLTTLDGVKALQVTAGRNAWLYVSDTAKPELIGLESPEGSSDLIAGVLSFSPGAPVTLTAPPASDVVEGSTAP